jgi:hypothetical protein
MTTIHNCSVRDKHPNVKVHITYITYVAKKDNPTEMKTGQENEFSTKNLPSMGQDFRQMKDLLR